VSPENIQISNICVKCDKCSKFKHSPIFLTKSSNMHQLKLLIRSSLEGKKNCLFGWSTNNLNTILYKC